MPKAKFAPLSPEARRLRSSLAVQSSQHPVSSPEVVSARRAYMVQRLIDMVLQLGPYETREEYQIKVALHHGQNLGPVELGVEEES